MYNFIKNSSKLPMDIEFSFIFYNFAMLKQVV
jgi:hypothetical protein